MVVSVWPQFVVFAVGWRFELCAAAVGSLLLVVDFALFGGNSVEVVKYLKRQIFLHFILKWYEHRYKLMDGYKHWLCYEINIQDVEMIKYSY